MYDPIQYKYFGTIPNKFRVLLPKQNNNLNFFPTKTIAIDKLSKYTNLTT